MDRLLKRLVDVSCVASHVGKRAWPFACCQGPRPGWVDGSSSVLLKVCLRSAIIKVGHGAVFTASAHRENFCIT
ncbi:MAG: hypothetical protein EBX67_05215 [Betaproteobacteria bacterium]|nr:hypothetical protein [Betaproteobacteria bacterium]NDH34862.1 hypothetical protein [Betaproteobacteria bacterium]